MAIKQHCGTATYSDEVGNDKMVDLSCSDSVKVLRTLPMELTDEERNIVREYLKISDITRAYIAANGHLFIVMNDGTERDVGDARGIPGDTPEFGDNGNWFIGGKDTGKPSRGPQGEAGLTPYVGENGNWWVSGVDLGTPATLLSVGTVLETFRTDLGDDWLLCNGAGIPEGEYPVLRELMPYNTEWVEAVPENEYMHVSPIPNTHKWVRVKRKVGSSTYAWDKAEVYDAETRTSLTVNCPLVVSEKTVELVGITHDGVKYVLAACCYGEKTAGRETLHLYASDDLIAWEQFYTYTLPEAAYPSDITFDGVAYVLLDGYVSSEGSSNDNYTRNAWLTPVDLSGTKKSSAYVGGGYKDARFRPCPPGYFSLAGDNVISRAGTGEVVMHFTSSSYAPESLVFFGDRYLLTVAEGSHTYGAIFYVVDLYTETKTEIDMGVLCGYESNDSNVRSYGCEYDKNTNEWVFIYGYIMSPARYYAVYISGDADPTDTTQYRVIKLKAAPETKYYLGQKSLNGASWCENAVRDPSLKCLPEQDGISYKYVYAGKEHAAKPVELEYIESTGTQYIDTEIIGKSGLEIEIDFEFTKIGTGSQIPVGSMKASSNRIYPLSSGNYVGYGEYVKLPMTAAANERYDIYCKLYAGEQTVTVNGTTIYTGVDPATYDSGCDMLLFAASNAGSVGYHSKVRVKKCKIREGGVLVRDYVPCRQPSGVVCMYDRVSGEYALNKGAGKFIAGAEVGVLEEV